MKYIKPYASIKNISVSLILALALFLIPSNITATAVTSSMAPTSTTAPDDTTPPQPNPSTTSPLPASTAAEENELCPISFMLENDPHQQNLLKEFRDVVLAEHKKGITYTKLYYIHSPEITLILLSHDAIKIHAQKILKELLPVITDLLNKGTAEISQPLIDDMDALLNEIAHQASSQLREAIRMAKSDIIKKEIFKEMDLSINKQKVEP